MKPRKCKQCRQIFTPERTFQPCCTVECAIVYAGAKMSAKRKKKVSQDKKAFKNSDKAILKRDVQSLANKIGKMQNMLKGEYNCVTCGKKPKQVDGGHFLPTSTYSPIRYNVCQINIQCQSCNRFRSGSPKEYREYMINKHGIKKVQWFESHKGQTRSYTVGYLQKYKRVMGIKYKKMKRKYDTMQ